MTGRAEWSPGGPEAATYRYLLRRTWHSSVLPTHEGTVLFVMLNPSTATAEAFDPTVRRCAAYTVDWGFRTMIVANIFALRSTDPQGLYDHAAPVGPRNDAAIQSAAREADLTVCAWGTHGALKSRGNEVLASLEAPTALRQTKAGHPSHPLYLPKALVPAPMQR